jgi:hypothetical protein
VPEEPKRLQFADLRKEFIARIGSKYNVLRSNAFSQTVGTFGQSATQSA